MLLRAKLQYQAHQLLPLEDIERNHISSVLAHTSGVTVRPNSAAQIPGLNPNTLRSRMAKLGIRANR